MGSNIELKPEIAGIEKRARKYEKAPNAARQIFDNMVGQMSPAFQSRMRYMFDFQDKFVELLLHKNTSASDLVVLVRQTIKKHPEDRVVLEAFMKICAWRKWDLVAFQKEYESQLK